MSRRGKRIYRKVLKIEPWGEVTRSGRQRYMRYLLECGHIQTEYFSARHVIRSFTLAHVPAADLKAHCRACAWGEGVHFDRITVGDISLLSQEIQDQVTEHFRKKYKKRKRQPLTGK